MEELPYVAALRRQYEMYSGRRRAGMPRLGWKVGINVPEVQHRLGLSQALVGFLDGERLYESGAQLGGFSSARLAVEPELCLTLHETVTAEADIERARAAIAHVQPAFEVVDYTKSTRSLNDIVEHSMFHAATVLGRPVPLPSVQAVAEAAGLLVFEVGGQYSPAARPGLVPHDLGEVVLLCARMLSHMGETLVAGDRLMSGAFVEKALPMLPGQEAVASFGALGQVRCSLA